MNANYKSCDCNDKTCYDQNIYKVRDYINLIDLKLSEISCNSLKLSSWGYSHKKIDKSEENILTVYKKFLLLVYKYLSNNTEVPLGEKEIQKVLERVSSYIDIDSTDYVYNLKVKKDNSKQQEYLLMNPGCQPYETWERALLGICYKLGISVKETSDNYKLVYEILSSNINDSCTIYYTLDVVTKAIEQKCFDVSIKNIASCKVDYDLIVSNTDCDLSFEMYMEMLSKNLSSTVIHNLYSSGGSLKLLSNEVHISINGISCKISDVTVNSKSSNIDGELVGRVLHTESENSLEIIQNLKNSYNNIVC